MPAMKSAQDDDSYSYSIDDLASNNEGSSSIHEFKSMPNVPIGDRSITTATKSQATSESDDTYSMDDDFVSSSKGEQSEEGQGKSACVGPPTLVERLQPKFLGNKPRYYHNEWRGLRSDDVKVSSSIPVQASAQSVEEKMKPESDAGYIGDIKCKTYSAESGTSPSIVEEMIQQSNPKIPLHDGSKAYSQSQCRVSFDPICVFIATKTPEGRTIIHEKPSQKGRQYSTQRLNELSQPSKHNIYNTPEKKDPPKKKSNAVSDGGRSFLERMKTMEIEKREKLQRATAEAIYNAKTDKNVCRNCGTTQSYDEMINGKKSCKNDLCRRGKHQYQPPKKFKLKSFEKRMEKSTLRRRLSIAKIEEDTRASFTVTTPKRNRRQQTLIEKVSADDFFTRMAKDIVARKEKLVRLEHNLRLEKEQRSFKPKSTNVKVAAGSGRVKNKKK